MKRKLNVGIVGASANGGWSPVAHIPALKALENIELEALCTSRPESAKAASEAFGIDRAYYNINDIVRQSDLDIISCVVNIPSHYEVVKAALENEKHVYCEWPLGATVEETEELANLANQKGVVSAIGLQGHGSPELLYIKNLVETGWFGQIVNIRMALQSKTSLEKASRKAWENEKHRRATLFSIVGGHTLYYLTHVIGGISELSADLSTQIKELRLRDTGEKISNEIYDQILIQGKLGDDIPFSTQLTAIPNKATGWQIEIYGTKGRIVATSPVMPQITPIAIQGAKGEDELMTMVAPPEYLTIEGLPDGPARNVGINYGNMAEAIVNGEEFHPNFQDALMMHRLLDTIELSSEEKRTIKLSTTKNKAN
ncbi:MAG: Gfo/Idh/MocA family oxidoreductase [Cytophagales bacterium]|nr:Gfo/Idh/MocA family oxidoreductase [Cytophagales bacterium]